MTKATYIPVAGSTYYKIRMEYLIPLELPVLTWRQANYPGWEQISERVKYFSALHEIDFFQLAQHIIIIIEEYSADIPMRTEIQNLDSILTKER